MPHPFHWCRNKNLPPLQDDPRVFCPNSRLILQWFVGDFFSSPWVFQWKGLSLLRLASRTRKWAFTFHPTFYPAPRRMQGNARHPAWCRAVSPTRFNSRHWDVANTETSLAQSSARPLRIAWDPFGNFCSWILQKVYGLGCWVNLEKVEGPNFDGSIWLSYGRVN